MDPGRRIRDFTGRARLWRSLGLSAGLLLRHGLWWALFLLLLDLVFPQWTWLGALVAALVLLVQLGGGLWRGRSVSWRRVLRPADIAGWGVLADQLDTWVQRDRRRQTEDPVVEWLEGDLVERLDALPDQSVRKLGRRPLGPVRYLIPLLVLLLLLDLLEPPLPGLRGSSPPPRGGGGGGVGDSLAQALPRPEPLAAEGIPPPEQPEEPGKPPEPEPPRPLLEDLRPEEQFVVPQFVGDGETRKELARQARVQEYGPAGPPPPRQGSGGEVESGEARDFEAAYERALRARNVPEQEREMVRRYFTLLREAGR